MVFLFLSAFFKVLEPLTSNHSPISIQFASNVKLKYMFMYKNYWSHCFDFMDNLIIEWKKIVKGDPIFALANKLKNVKITLLN